MISSSEKVVNKVNEKSINTCQIGVYTVYDCVSKQFSAPISVPKSKVRDYFTLMVNDVQSPYYNHESDYILNEIGIFNTDTGEIELKFIERVCILDSFIEQKRRNLQTLIQTLNYLPTGYFKMPAEQKELIQENINSAVQKYVNDYVIPDLDIQAEKKKLNDLSLDEVKEKLMESV